MVVNYGETVIGNSDVKKLEDRVSEFECIPGRKTFGELVSP